MTQRGIVSNRTQPVVSPDRVFTVRVPASTSNLGAGFDAVGMAIGRWLSVTARVRPNGAPVRINRAGTLLQLDCSYGDDLIWRGFIAACVALRCSPPDGVELDATSDIPVARGLGSSASAIVAGALLANAMFDGGLDDAAIIDIAASSERHPDNVAPAVLGGAVLSVRTTGHHYRSVQLAVHPSLQFVFIVPEFEIRTAVARAALPAQLDFTTAVSAAGRAAALIVGLQLADEAILGVALDDLLHVPFRRTLITGYDRVVDAAITAGAIGATLSGSGSSIVAVVDDGSADAVAGAAVRAWQSMGVAAETFTTAAESTGATVDIA
jgi:homoserine kinase